MAARVKRHPDKGDESWQGTAGAAHGCYHVRQDSSPYSESITAVVQVVMHPRCMVHVEMHTHRERTAHKPSATQPGCGAARGSFMLHASVVAIPPSLLGSVLAWLKPTLWPSS